jgi:hypothetical protein
VSRGGEPTGRAGGGRALDAPGVLAVLATLGAALRLWQYGANASLWADEGNMALNLVRRPLSGLVAPLDYHQVAPVGWLALEKGAIGLLGDSEPVLRLFPLLCSLASLPLFLRVARRTLTGRAVPLAVLLFALGIPLIFYAAQLKPYASDVLAAVVILLLALELRRLDLTAQRAWGLGLIGAVTVWLSHAAVFVLAGAGATCAVGALVAHGRQPGARPGRLAVTLALWAASTLGATLVATRSLSPAAATYLARFWDPSFWPLPPGSLADVVWPVARLTGVFGGGGFRYPVPGLFLILALVGVGALWRRSPAVALLVWTPVGLTFAASALHLYPFAPRVVLFLCPAFLVSVAAGAEFLRTLTGRGARGAGTALMAACAALAVFGLVRNPPPYMPEHLKPVLDFVTRERRPGDAVYVYYGGEKAFRYYASRYGFRDGDYVMGGCWRDDPRAYLRELDRFRGTPRLWVVLTHARPDLGEDALILGYLDRIGTRSAAYRASAHPRDQRINAAVGYLYDLSNPERLTAASAETFPARERGGSDEAWSC